MIKVINKQGETVFEKKSKIKANTNDYKPVPSRTERMLRPAEGSPYQKAIKKIMEKNEPSGRFSRADIELAEKMLKRKGGGISKIDKLRSTKGQFTIGGRLKTLKDKLKKSFGKKTGGAMLKNPDKADLDKDGKLSGYEKKRGMAIEKSMSGKPMKAAAGALALGALGALGLKKLKKKKGIGMGLASKLAEKKKEILGAKRGKFAKTGPRSEFGEYNKMRDLFERQKKMQQRKKEMEKDKEKISERKKGIAVKSGGMMKYNKGGGADTGKKGEMKSKLGVMSNKVKRVNERLKKLLKRPKLQAPERGPMKPLKAMGGGMMNKPMSYKKGTMVMARGCKLGRKKPTKIM